MGGVAREPVAFLVCFAVKEEAKFFFPQQSRAGSIQAWVTGMDVPQMIAEGKYREIAEYCLRDVRATVELYRVWKDRLAGIK